MTRIAIISILVLLVITGIVLSVTSDVELSTKKVPAEDGLFPYIEIENPSGFVNTDGVPITIGEHIGKNVVLIDFMTYSCINCQRAFPHLVDLDQKYRDDGLVIIGIHTPEFSFEKNIENVERELGKFGITFPVVLDNDYGTWRAWGNRFWPRKYLIDINGNVVYDHIGEGAYRETEEKVQELLKERAQVLGEQIDDEELTDAADDQGIRRRSPEIYFGASRNEFLANGQRGVLGPQAFTRPDSVILNELYLVGEWDIQREYVETQGADTRIIFRYQAGEVNIVAGSAEPIDISVSVDGGPEHVVTVEQATLYNLVQHEYGEHVLEITIPQGGFQAFTFTFGA